MKNSTLTTGLIAVAMMSSATLLSAHTVDFGNAPAQAKTSEATILLAQTKTKKNSKDKRDCKQDGRKN